MTNDRLTQIRAGGRLTADMDERTTVGFRLLAEKTPAAKLTEAAKRMLPFECFVYWPPEPARPDPDFNNWEEHGVMKGDPVVEMTPESHARWPGRNPNRRWVALAWGELVE